MHVVSSTIYKFPMFKQDFKYFKSKKSAPNLDEVLDLNQPAKLEEKCIIKRHYCNLENSSFQYGLRKPDEWEIYEFLSHKGLLFVKNPFISAGQRYWIRKALEDYTKRPSKLNIDNFNVVPSNKDWWTLAQTDKSVLERLRWSTLGYHHNWDTKLYTDNNRSDFPDDLKHLTQYIANLLGFSTFVAEAAIVNYYHLDSTLSGHTDHSEQNLEAPLFSFSFGQTAIFLIGGHTIDEKPTALFLRSGDVLIMSKDSRLCYHGVPRVMITELDIWNKDDGSNNNADIKYFIPNDSIWKPFNVYISNSRININVRQVLNIGQLHLDS